MGKYFFVSVFLFAFSVTSTAQNGGLSFLKIGFDARNVALGDVGVSAAKDVSASAYNPAWLAYDENTQITFTHNSWMKDVTSELLGTKFNLFGLNFGVSINSSSVKDIEVRESPGEPVASFNANYFFAGIASGFQITENLSFGVNAKYVYESLFSEDAYGFGFDFGANYTNLTDNLDLSFSVQNVGSMNKLKNEATEMPASVSLGAGYLIPINTEDFEVTAFVSSRKFMSEDNIHFNFAAEGVYKKTLFIRAGYQTGYEARDYSLGFGFAWRGFNIDYAYAPFGAGLGNSHVIGVKYKF